MNWFGLAEKSIAFPDSVLYVGSFSFLLAGVTQTKRIGVIRHPHRADVTGTLPGLEVDTTPLNVPPEALTYTSVVDSTHKNILLHQGAQWVDEDLTGAALRFYFGQQPNSPGKVDFLVVLGPRSSWTQATQIDPCTSKTSRPPYTTGALPQVRPQATALS